MSRESSRLLEQYREIRKSMNPDTNKDVKLYNDIMPRGTKILLVADKDIDKIGTIYIPGNGRMEKQCRGELIAIGPDCQKDIEGNYTLTLGSWYIWGEYAGTEIELLNGKYKVRLMNEIDLLGEVDLTKKL